MFLRRWFDEIVWAIQYDESTVDLVGAVLRGNVVINTPYRHESLNLIGLDEYLVSEDSHLERIQFMKKYFKSEEFLCVLKITDQSLRKSDLTAKMLMNKSDDFYGSSDVQRAISTLNIAACFATKKTLRRIYRKRSVWLFNLGNWEGCLRDTELGLTIDCPATTKEKLSFQKLKCLAMYNKYPKREISQKQGFRDFVLFNLYKGGNVKIPGLSCVVEIRWNEKTGRGLYLKEDVGSGKTVIIEEPYVTNLNRGLNWDVDHCWRCLERVQNTTPCDGCVFAVYCNEECRSADFEMGHCYECPCLPYFHGASIGPNTHLGFKAICRAGPLELYKVYTTAAMYPEYTEEDMGLDPKTGKYDASSYWSIAGLKFYVENNGQLPEHAWVSLSFVEILDNKTDFFDHIFEDLDRKRFKEFVACLALISTLSIPFNCVGLSEVDRCCSVSDKNIDISGFQRKSTPYVGGLYPLISTLNHSCDPSVGRVNFTNGRMAIMTLRGLKAGDELLMSYGFEYGNHSKEKRFNSLLKLYLFKCYCTPCKFNWPLYDDLRKVKNRFRCPNCSDKFSYEESDECALEHSKNEMGTCPHCKNQFSFKILIDELLFHSSDLEMAREFLLKNDPHAAIHVLLGYIKFLQSKLCSPSFPLCAAQRILLKSYYLIMDN